MQNKPVADKIPSDEAIAAMRELVRIADTGTDLDRVDTLAKPLGKYLRVFAQDIRGCFNLSDVIVNGNDMPDAEYVKAAIAAVHQFSAEHEKKNLPAELSRSFKRRLADLDEIKSGKPIDEYNWYGQMHHDRVKQQADVAKNKDKLTVAIEAGDVDAVKQYAAEGGKLSSGHFFSITSPYDAEFGPMTKLDDEQKAAVHEGQKQIAQFLLEQGRRIDIQIGNLSVYRNTLLHTLISNMDHETAHLIIDAAIAVNQSKPGTVHFEGCDTQGKTALQMAAMTQQTEMVEKLLDAGADPNSIDYFQSTAMHKAAIMGNLAMLKALMGHGGRLDIKDMEGNTPLDYVARGGDTTEDAKWTMTHVWEQLRSIDISPEKHFDAKRSFPIRLVKVEDTLLMVAVSGKEGRRGFDGHKKVTEYLRSQGAKLGSDIEQPADIPDMALALLKDTTGVEWEKKNIDGKLVYITAEALPERKQQFETTIKEMGVKPEDGCATETGHLVLEADSFTADIRAKMGFAHEKGPDISLSKEHKQAQQVIRVGDEVFHQRGATHTVRADGKKWADSLGPRTGRQLGE